MNRWFALAVLILLGAGWGFTQPLSKIAVSGDYRHFGLIFWQFVIAASVLFTLNRVRGKGLPFDRAHLRLYIIIALVGTILPNAASYEAARFLPSGIMSIVISTVPMFAFPLAILMRQDRFSFGKLAGLLLGIVGVCLLVAPKALPDSSAAVYIPLALVASVFYAFEGNYVSRYGTGNADAIQTLLGSSLVGILLSVPFALGTGSWITPSLPLGIHDYALIGSSIIHAIVYATYVWLIRQAGPVFTSQVGYLVTGFGIVWAMLILGETYSGPFWLSVAIVLSGVALVSPKATR